MAIVTIERQLEVICVLWNCDISNDLDGPQTRFQGHDIFEVEYLKNGASHGQSYKETIHGLSNGTAFNDLD